VRIQNLNKRKERKKVKTPILPVIVQELSPVCYIPNIKNKLNNTRKIYILGTDANLPGSIPTFGKR
jgi:hypothetical protein